MEIEFRKGTRLQSDEKATCHGPSKQLRYHRSQGQCGFDATTAHHTGSYRTLYFLNRRNRHSSGKRTGHSYTTSTRQCNDTTIKLSACSQYNRFKSIFPLQKVFLLPWEISSASFYSQALWKSLLAQVWVTNYKG